MSPVSLSADCARHERLGQQAWVMRGLALGLAQQLVAQVASVQSQAPFRHMIVPGGSSMSVAMTNCGSLGWVSSRRGYRYTVQDPESGRQWPPMPPAFLRLAADSAALAGFEGFVPDACLINRYEPGARLALHQDRNERDFDSPIVSISLGLPAVFLFGGQTRSERAARIRIEHGDVVVWGGADRLRFHGVMPLKAAPDDGLFAESRSGMPGGVRINLTLRRAG